MKLARKKMSTIKDLRDKKSCQEYHTNKNNILLNWQ